ncbi:hypothetical protein BGX34_006513, partial [Mortierella sp. NVP85]
MDSLMMNISEIKVISQPLNLSAPLNVNKHMRNVATHCFGSCYPRCRSRLCNQVKHLSHVFE